MNRATIRYKDKKALDAVIDMGRHLDLSVDSPERSIEYINGIPMMKGGGNIEQAIEELSDIFTGLNLDAKKLRREAWGREK